MRFSPAAMMIALVVATTGPALWIVWSVAIEPSSPDPVKVLVDATGLWALRLLWLCLAMTPLRRLTGLSNWVQARRPLGLAAFVYACVHVAIYLFLLLGGDWSRLGEELTRRPYIVVGALAFLLMMPQALTSTRGWQRRLKQRWVRLHQMVYFIAVLALLHFTWLKKLGILATGGYAAVLAGLLLVRVHYRRRVERQS